LTEEVRDLFASYRAAFADYDEDRICRFFNYPNLVVDAGSTRLNADETDMRAMLAELFSQYREKRVTEPRVLSLVQTEPSPWLTQAAVTWGLFDDEGTSVVRFHTTYTLKRIEDALRIVFVIAHDENQAFADAEHDICYIGMNPLA